MTQWVKFVEAAKTEEDLIPENHTVKGESDGERILLKVVL